MAALSVNGLRFNRVEEMAAIVSVTSVSYNSILTAGGEVSKYLSYDLYKNILHSDADTLELA